MNPSRMQDEAGITTQAARFATDRSVSFPSAALNFARLSFYDIFAVALAGQDEPASRIVRELVVREGGTPQASAFGMETRIPPRAAALLNGTVAHALDYDDTHFAFVGHPSVAVLPAALAVAEQQQADGNAVLEAFLCGVEATCRIGQWLGRAHYNAGFHQTATSGAFGATAACSRLLGLDVTQATHAFGLAATRASGLKCQFGSMGKPFHAGMAAANGVEAATLASLGFESRRDAIEGTGGFASTHGAQTAHGSDPFGGLPQHFRFVDVQYKFHACCHGTHPALEALLALRTKHGLLTEDIDRVKLHINPQWLPVCCIARPQTGLEAKFSLAFTAAMVLNGLDTAAPGAFSDSMCGDPALVSLMQRVSIHADPEVTDTASRAVIEMRDGSCFEHTVELADPIPSAEQLKKLQGKARALIGAALSEDLWCLVEALHTLPAREVYPRIHALMNP